MKPLFTDSLKKIKNPPELETLYPLLSEDAIAQATIFWRGVKRYQDYKTILSPSKTTPLWSRFSSTLWDYGGDGKRPFFIIPSLVNKSSILDLRPENSFIAALKKHGFHPLMLDWGVPGETESHMDIGDYMDLILRPALAEVNHAYGKPDLMGYCMGGIMALQLSHMLPDRIKKLVLLATPINFKTGGISYPDATLHHFLEATTAYQGLIPSEATPSTFWLKDPFLIIKKYQKFATLDQAFTDSFVAIEDWVNDTVPLSKWVARTTLKDWYIENKLATNRWQFDLSKITTPTLMISPTRDSVVPKAASEILKDFIKASQLSPQTGHVGLVSDPKIQAEYLPKIKGWLAE